MSDILLNKMLPNSLNKSKMLRSINEVLQPFVDANWDVLIPRLFLYSRIDELPEEFLNHLAYQFHVDFWEVSLPIEKKRTLIKNSIKYHKHKGTPYAVEQLLSDVFNDTWLKEWFEYGGKPYYFKIFTKDFISSEKMFNDFIRALFTVKNTRSWLDEIVLVRDWTIYYALYSQKAKHITVLPNKIEDFETTHNLYMGIATVHKKIKRTAIMPDVWTLNDTDMFLEVEDSTSEVRLRYDE